MGYNIFRSSKPGNCTLDGRTLLLYDAPTYDILSRLGPPLICGAGYEACSHSTVGSLGEAEGCIKTYCPQLCQFARTQGTTPI